MIGITEAAQAVLKVIRHFGTKEAGQGLLQSGTDELKARALIGQGLISVNGNMANILGDYIIEPTIFVTEDAAESAIIDSVSMLLVDIFGAFYMQVFEILTDEQMYGLSGKVALKLLSTNIPGKGLSESLKRSIGKEVIRGLTREHSLRKDFHLDKDIDGALEFMDTDESLLTFEGSGKIHPAGSTNGVAVPGGTKFDASLASSLLQRTIKVTISTKRKDGELLKVSIPIIIRANVEKIKPESIVKELIRQKAGNDTEMGLLEVKAGLKNLGDLIFSTSIIKEYGKGRIKNGDQLAKLLQEKRNNSAVQLAATGAVGFEKNYNLYVISDADMEYINNKVNKRLYDNDDKEDILADLNAMALVVCDEEASKVNLLTSKVRGVSTTSYRNLQSKTKEQGSDLTEILKAIFTSKPII